MKKVLKITVLSLCIGAFLFTLSGCTRSKTTRFKKPSIKDDFCGIIMNFQYCKCAFHNEYCDVVGLSSAGANSYIRAEYSRWLDYRMNKFKDDCRQQGGIYHENGKCEYCNEPYYRKGNKCIAAEEDEDEDEQEEGEFKPDGPFNNDCSINEDQFSQDWMKYSDFDNRIPFESRSWEAQSGLKLQDQIISLKVENFKLQRDMEIDRQLRLEVREFRNALAKNLKANLVKATLRLSYITYTTIKNGWGAGKSYESILTGTENIKRLGAAISTVRGLVPSDSSLAIDTNSVTGKAASGGLSVAIEALENLGDPKSIVNKVMTETSAAILPSADITPEEVAILKDQYIVKNIVEHSLAESYKENAKRRKKLLDNQNKIKELEASFAAWEAKEKQRVKQMLEDSCLKQKENYEE